MATWMKRPYFRTKLVSRFLKLELSAHPCMYGMV